MKRHFLALGIIVALTFFSLFYLSFSAHLISIEDMNLVVRLILPLIVGGYALVIGRRWPWLPLDVHLRRKLVMTLLPLLSLAFAAVALLHVGQTALFLRGLGLNLLTTISTVLFWQGLIWPQMKKTSGVYLKALRLSLLQVFFAIFVVFIAMLPVSGFYSLWGLLSLVKTLKLFQSAGIVGIGLAAFSVMLLCIGLVNLALAQMMEWTGSILYPALTYSVTTFLLLWEAQSILLVMSQWLGFLLILLAAAVVGAFIYLYVGARRQRGKASERAHSL